MAGVKSLALRGIRSFGPDEVDEQRISFDKPLTLILGQNGCGKTTIIECLRYAITGQMPPGSRNECFVHDTKVNRSTEVTAHVKLKIVNAKDRQLEVARSMRVTAMQKKTKFQTLESLMTIIDENGKPKDMSSRCADLDFVMQEELGVSKAILNSVIFCHQEDSSWPLDEGKKVKERFDEIFDADKYSDCFDRLRKIRKDYTQNLKLLEQEVSFLTEKKQDLDKKKLEVINTETRISEAELKVAELASELKPITEKIQAIHALQKSLVASETKKEKIKTRLEHCQGQEKELKAAIKNLYEGPLNELEENINNYAATTVSKKKELAESYKKNSLFNNEEEKIANEKTSNEVKVSKLLLLESQNQEKIDRLNVMIVDAAKLAELDMSEITTAEAAEKGIKEITEKIKSLRAGLNEQKAQADAEEKKLQAIINESRESQTRQKEKISSKEAEINSGKKEITKVEKQINDANESKVKLEAMEKKMETAEEEYKNFANELNPEEAQKEINEDEKNMETQEQSLEEVSDKISKLQKQSTKIKERDMIEEGLKQKEKQLSVLMNKHKTSLTDLLGQVPEKDFAVVVNKYECGLKSEVDAMKKKLKQKQIEVTKLETEHKHVRERLTERRNELTAAEDKMYQACGSQTYDATLTKTTNQVEKLQDEQNVLQSSMFIIKKYKSQLQDNSCCPVCNRGFDSENEVSNLISQMTTQVMNVPTKLEQVTTELQIASTKKDNLLAMKSLNEKITSLRDKGIPEFEISLKDIDVRKLKANEEMEELTVGLVEPEQKLQLAKQIHGDMPLLDRYSQEIATATKQLEAAAAKCGVFECDMTLEEATARHAELKQSVVALRAKVKTARVKLNQHNKKLNNMADKKNKLKEQLLNLQKKVQEIFSLQEKKGQLEANQEKFAEELKELQNGLPALEAEVKEKEKNKTEVVKKNRSEIETKNNYIMSVVKAFDQVKSVQTEIKQHKERNIQREMDKIKEANDKLMEKQKQIMVDRDALTKRIDSLRDELAKQEIYERDLKDNLKLRKAQLEIEKSEKELVEINEKLNGMDREMLAEEEPLIVQQTKLFREKAQTEGMLNSEQARLTANRNELKKAQRHDVEKKYREKYYELYVTKAIDKDIKEYSVALEKCLMEFHKEKMENINLIIREMWRKIYRGNDIDYIEIKTEGSMSADSDRRKYDYRVVQCKNGVEIDMRGRCSAGQKVLACLIIRLALAETFSARFGILALDEPTTNLDQENVTSLCSALGEIVRERMKQKNFMFIIITHDKEFIDSLGNIDKVTHYYEVSRNDDGKSRIKKIRFS